MSDEASSPSTSPASLSEWFSTIEGPRPFPAVLTAWLTSFTGGQAPVYAEVHLSCVDKRVGSAMWTATVVTKTAVVVLKRGRTDGAGALLEPGSVDVVAVPLSTTARVSRVHSDSWTAEVGAVAPVKLVVSDREHLLGLGPEFPGTESSWRFGSTEAVLAAVHTTWAR